MTVFISEFFEKNPGGHKAFCDELRESLTLKSKSRNSLRSGYDMLYINFRPIEKLTEKGRICNCTVSLMYPISARCYFNFVKLYLADV